MRHALKLILQSCTLSYVLYFTLAERQDIISNGDDFNYIIWGLGIAIGVSFFIGVAIYYFSRGEDASRRLGRQFDSSGNQITRADMKNGDITEQWLCQVCDFQNRKDSKACILCGTEKSFEFNIKTPQGSIAQISSNGDCHEFSSFKRQRSFAIRRLNELNQRQRGARYRNEWVRRVGINGKRHWSRRKVLHVERSSSNLSKYPSLAFISRIKRTPEHPDGALEFESCNQRDPAFKSSGERISEEDLSSLEEIASRSFSEKCQWFVQQTQQLMTPWEAGHLKVQIDRLELIDDSIAQLEEIDLHAIHMPIRIHFKGESGLDAGGLLREWFILLTDQLFDESNGLFCCSHVENKAYMINPNSGKGTKTHLTSFHAIGRLIGRGLLEGLQMKAHLALPILKHILGVPISLTDLQFVDGELYNSLRWMKQNDGVSALGLDFTINTTDANGKIQLIELKPGGQNIEVNDENKQEYIYAHLNHVMFHSIRPQLQNLMTGLFEVIPQELLLVFDYQELELLLCGMPTIDVEDWRKHTEYSEGFPKQLAEWFWEIVQDFNDEEKAKLLQYATGSSRVPVQGFKALTCYDGNLCFFSLEAISFPQHAYPHAHTCFNRIDLPKYRTKQQLRYVLAAAINMEMTGFSSA